MSNILEKHQLEKVITDFANCMDEEFKDRQHNKVFKKLVE